MFDEFTAQPVSDLYRDILQECKHTNEQNIQIAQSQIHGRDFLSALHSLIHTNEHTLIHPVKKKSLKLIKCL